MGVALFAEVAGGSAKAFFDGAVLAFEGAADAAELGAGVVGEGAIGFDLAAEAVEERGEGRADDGVEEVGGEGFDGGPVVAGGVGCGVEEGAPGGDALGYGEEREDLEGFEGGAFDAGFVEEEGRVEEAVEGEAAAGGEEGAELGGALVLLVEPGAV